MIPQVIIYLNETDRVTNTTNKDSFGLMCKIQKTSTILFAILRVLSDQIEKQS